MDEKKSQETYSINNQNPSHQGKNNQLLKKVKNGSIWTITSHGGSQIIRFLNNLIMTRLLFEEAFGIMAIVSTFLVGLQLFSDIGIGPSIIQNKRGEEPEFYNTAWTIQVVRGFVLFLVALTGAVPFSMFYNEPLLAKLIAVSGINAFIQGFASTKLFINNRNLDMKRLAIIELISQIASMAIMIIWAVIDRSIWALVVGGIAGTTTKTILSHTMLPGEKNRFHWNNEDSRSLYHFGRWIFISTMITFFAQQSDRLIFGKMIPFTLLGIYHIGSTLGNIPLQILKQLMGRVFFPLFSRINEANKDLSSAFTQTRWIILVFAGWVYSGFIAGGTTIVDILYDDRYLQAGWIVQFISIGCWFSICMDSYGAILLSRAKTFQLAVSNATKFVSMIIFIFLGNKFFGFKGAVLGIAASELCRLIVITIASARIGHTAWHQDLFLGAIVAGVSICVSFADIYLAGYDCNVKIRAAVVFFLVSLLWAPVVFKVYKTFLKKIIYNKY
ncbi:MAG TPA: oligosaccharide flippase family protein [Spirochaetota bacterium]|nr:oligosaccharide flippase family protein [Spirochaetota bacterium]HPR49829.1 oligosaccharide flippase family protein [Spirochaetota bacterium]